MIRKVNVILKLLFVAAVFFLLQEGKEPSLAQFNHPELKWKVIETPHFLIHYHQGEEILAQQISLIAENLYRQITGDLGYRPSEKVPVIMENYDDLSGGYTSPLPAKIVIRALSPTLRTSGTLSWIQEVLGHELTHYVTFAAIDESLIPLRRMMAGLTLPMWFIEGLAQYEAEEWHSLKEMMVGDQASQKKLFSEGDLGAFYFFDEWGRTQGYYQSDSLVRYIFEKYGKDKISAILSHLRQQPLYQLIGEIELGTGSGMLYPVSRFLSFENALKNSLGKDSLALYREWRSSLIEKYQSGQSTDFLSGRKPLTSEGRRNQYPRFSPSGEKIAFVSNRGYDFAIFNLYLREIGTGGTILLERNVNLAFSFAPNGETLIFSKTQFYSPDRTFLSDLYLIDLSSKKVKRLTFGLRATEPCFSPDGKNVVFVKQGGGCSNLWLLDLSSGKTTPLTNDMDGLTQNFSPSFSPEGERIVFVSFRQGSRDIYLLNLKDKTVVPLTQDKYDDRCPTFSPGGEKIYFVSNASGAFDLYSLNLTEQTKKRYTRVKGGLFDPDIQLEGQKIVFSAYGEEKFSLYLCSLDEIGQGEPVPAAPPEKIRLIEEYSGPRETEEFISYPYRPQIKLHYLLPSFYIAEDQSYLSLEAYASDVLEKDNFLLTLSLLNSLQYDFIYLTRRLQPNLWLEAFHRDGYFSFQNHYYPSRRKGVAFGLTHYFIDNLGLGLSYTTQRMDSFLFNESDELEEWQGTLNSISAGLTFSSLIPVCDPGLNPQGRRLCLKAEYSGPILNSQMEYLYYALDWRGYLRLSPRNALALRLLGEKVENGQSFPRYLISLGGEDTLRGFSRDSLVGENLLYSSLEWRFLLASRMGGSSSLYLDRLAGAVFLDAGAVWEKDKELTWEDVRKDAGLEMRLRILPFGKYPLILKIGVAWPLEERRNQARAFIALGDVF